MAGESKLQKRCRAAAKTYGVISRKVNTDGESGWPDLELLFPVNGETVFVEMKNPNDKGGMSPTQIQVHKRIRKQGADVYVCLSFTYFMVILRHHLGKIK